MADLVAEHGSEIRLVLEVGQDAARDVDVAAHGREGVHVVGVDDREMPLELGPLAHCRELLADPLHIVLELDVLVHAHLLGEHDVHLLGRADFLAVLLRLFFCSSAPKARAAGDDGQRGEGSRRASLPVIGRMEISGPGPKGTGPGLDAGAVESWRPSRRRWPYFRPYFLRKRSTRPPESTIFCLPV